MISQEDGFIEVKCYLASQTPILKRVRPVKVKKIKLLFDVFAMMVMARDSGVDFSQMSQMEVEEQLAWMVYGGIKSYASLHNRRSEVTIEDALSYIDGMLAADRVAVLNTIKDSRAIGKLAESYQKAREDMAEEGTGSKKDPGQVSGQTN